MYTRDNVYYAHPMHAHSDVYVYYVIVQID